MTLLLFFLLSSKLESSSTETPYIRLQANRSWGKTTSHYCLLHMLKLSLDYQVTNFSCSRSKNVWSVFSLIGHQSNCRVPLLLAGAGARVVLIACESLEFNVCFKTDCRKPTDIRSAYTAFLDTKETLQHLGKTLLEPKKISKERAKAFLWVITDYHKQTEIRKKRFSSFLTDFFSVHVRF